MELYNKDEFITWIQQVLNLYNFLPASLQVNNLVTFETNFHLHEKYCHKLWQLTWQTIMQGQLILYNICKNYKIDLMSVMYNEVFHLISTHFPSVLARNKSCDFCVQLLLYFQWWATQISDSFFRHENSLSNTMHGKRTKHWTDSSQPEAIYICDKNCHVDIHIFHWWRQPNIPTNFDFNLMFEISS